MAHLIKATRGATGGLTRHFERYKTSDDEYIKFGNQDIDKNKSHLNYNLAEEKNQLEFIKKRISEIRCLNRKNVNVMCSWVVTLPGKIKTQEDQDLFFRESYKFLENLYGKENVVSSFVHLDETTPHMHFAFIPVVYDKKKEEYKVSAKELINRKHLQEFHPRLEDYMKKVFNRDIGILNDATKEGNKSIEELKRGTAKKDLEALNSSLEHSKKELGMLVYSKDKIQILGQIKAKNNIFNKDYIQIKKEDFDNLIYMAKNYIKDTEYLRDRNKYLEKENERMKERINKKSMDEMMHQTKKEFRIQKLEKDNKVLSEFIIKRGLANEFNKEIKITQKEIER